MPETHFEIRKRFVTTMRYPTRTGWAIRDAEAWIHEVEPPFRMGSGTSFRLPGCRWAVIFGRWDDDGGPEEERLRNALGVKDVAAETAEIAEW